MRILITDGMEKAAVELLHNHGFETVEQFYEIDELIKQIRDFDAVIVRSATKIRQPVIDAAAETGRLKLIIRGGVGVDNIDVEYAKSHGMTVANTPAASSAAVAELAIGHMFCVARYIHIANHTMRLGQWNKKNYEGVELSGKTLGLIGFGRIAREVAKRARALGMKVIYTNRSGPKTDADPFVYAPFYDLLAQSDFISLHIPGSYEKVPVLGPEQFAKMKDGVYIINTSRGGLISEEALLNALDSGKVTAAALDVFDEEPVKNPKIFTHDRISMTPHIGASTKEAQERIGYEITRIVFDFFKVS